MRAIPICQHQQEPTSQKKLAAFAASIGTEKKPAPLNVAVLASQGATPLARVEPLFSRKSCEIQPPDKLLAHQEPLKSDSYSLCMPVPSGEDTTNKTALGGDCAGGSGWRCSDEKFPPVSPL